MEYWAVAEQLASFRPPSMTEADIQRLELEARRIGHGFEVSPLRFPELIGGDRRQDFPHFWLYPLVNVPGLWVTRLVGLHPNWAFTFTNCALLLMAFAIVSMEVSMAWAGLVLLGPLMWWLDKAHGDVFAVSMLASACALWARMPHWTLLFFAPAAAQNPALMPAWCLVAIVALSRIGREPGIRTRDAARVGLGVLVGAIVIVTPLAYYYTRLHVWSPLVGYTRLGWPSLRTMTSLVFDPNVGLIPNVPAFGVATIMVIAVARPSRRSVPLEWRNWLLAAGGWGLLLTGYAQSVNVNHGATPGVNRWTLWLLPLLLLVVPRRLSTESEAAPPRLETGLIALVVLNTAWGVWFFRPSLPEVYRAPTRSASWLWTHAPAWYSPAPEIFAERVSGREPPALPAAWEGCTKVLAIEGQWPAPCLPPRTIPSACLEPGSLCYANGADVRLVTTGDSDNTTSFVSLGTSSFPNVLTPQRWSPKQPFVTTLSTRITGGRAGDSGLIPQRLSTSALRATSGIAWASVWASTSTIALYLDTVAPDATLWLRVDVDYRGRLIDLDTDRTVADIEVGRSGGNPAAIKPATAVRHALLWLERQ